MIAAITIKPTSQIPLQGYEFIVSGMQGSILSITYFEKSALLPIPSKIIERKMPSTGIIFIMS